jgi:predicted secreted protein
MRKSLTTIVLASCFLTVFAAGTKTSTTISKVPPNGVLTAKKPIYTLALNSNPTTGYAWFMVSYPKDLVDVVGHQYVASTSGLMGAGGVDKWQFKALKSALALPHVIKIQMMYARPWEINDQSPVQTFYLVTD